MSRAVSPSLSIGGTKRVGSANGQHGPLFADASSTVTGNSAVPRAGAQRGSATLSNPIPFMPASSSATTSLNHDDDVAKDLNAFTIIPNVASSSTPSSSNASSPSPAVVAGGVNGSQLNQRKNFADAARRSITNNSGNGLTSVSASSSPVFTESTKLLLKTNGGSSESPGPADSPKAAKVFATRPIIVLPPACTGAVGLVIPALLRGKINNITLPSRLALLGRQSYQTLAALRPINLGNSVLGFAPIWVGRPIDIMGLWTNKKNQPSRVQEDLFVLPWIFSKSGARITFFLRILISLVVLVFVLQFSQLYTLNVGRVWLMGCSIAIAIMYQLALIRCAPDGVMAFCRSMGAPEVEEYMFSYCWKVQPDAIRTLAKAVWNNGVGVWIDVVKLCPGDEIRPLVRTMVQRVQRCVVFLSPAYMASPNCCVEFHQAVQRPEKLLLCVMVPTPGMDDFIAHLEMQGAVVVYGMRELITQLDFELCNVTDQAAWRWWRRQRISGGGVPSHVVPDEQWSSIPLFSMTGRLGNPARALTAGPVFLAGDCSESGIRFCPPWLFITAVFAAFANFADITNTFVTNVCTPTTPTQCHSTLDYVWLGLMAICNLAPLTSLGLLFDTRTEVHAVLRPLLASKSMHGGVKLRIIGSDDDPIVQHLRNFLERIGHLAPKSDLKSPEERSADAVNKSMKGKRKAASLMVVAAERMIAAQKKRSEEKDSSAASLPGTIEENPTKLISVGAAPSNDAVSPSPLLQVVTAPAVAPGLARKPSALHSRKPSSGTQPSSGLLSPSKSISMGNVPEEGTLLGDAPAAASTFNPCITVFVMRTIADRDILFGSDAFPFDQHTSLFVWSAPGDPFTHDIIGERLMRFLVLIAAWDGKLLAENLFSAVGVRVVDLLHSGGEAGDDEMTEEQEAEAMTVAAAVEAEKVKAKEALAAALKNETGNDVAISIM